VEPSEYRLEDRDGAPGGGVRGERGGRRVQASAPREIQFKKRVAPVARATAACVGRGSRAAPPQRAGGGSRCHAGNLLIHKCHATVMSACLPEVDGFGPKRAEEACHTR
jgi:hypothetical protein